MRNRDFGPLIALIILGMVAFAVDHHNGGQMLTEIQIFLRQNGF